MKFDTNLLNHKENKSGKRSQKNDLQTAVKTIVPRFIDGKGQWQ